MSEEKIARLRGRLEGVRDVSGDSATAAELEAALAELDVLWDELQHQADRLAFERYRYASLYEQAPYASVITDVNGTMLEANRSAIQLLDVPAPTILKKPLVIFIDEADRPLFRTRLARACLEPNKPIEPFAVKLKLARRSDVVEVRILCLPHNAEHPAAMMCFLRRIE
jgi:PAS domain-containing protein